MSADTQGRPAGMSGHTPLGLVPVHTWAESVNLAVAVGSTFLTRQYSEGNHKLNIRVTRQKHLVRTVSLVPTTVAAAGPFAGVAVLLQVSPAFLTGTHIPTVVPTALQS